VTIKPEDFSNQCASIASDLLLSMRDPHSTAGLMLLVHDAVRKGAEYGLDVAEQIFLGNDAAKEFAK
jgi:hypothetical protein